MVGFHAMMNSRIAGFSLVEVTIAIGIFAFVIVGIVGLLPVGFKQRQDAALETRAVMIGRQIFESIDAAGTLSSVNVSVGEDERVQVNLVDGPLVLGYERDGTAPGVNFKGDAGKWSSEYVEQDVVTKSIATATNLGGGLYRVDVDVGFPAMLPVDKRRIYSFSRLVYQP